MAPLLRYPTAFSVALLEWLPHVRMVAFSYKACNTYNLCLFQEGQVRGGGKYPLLPMPPGTRG